uniref:Putative venom protein n=1 Tax=Superstitionia donensis TaxID=311983 RepID=A0A1V1WBH2_9SCOR
MKTFISIVVLISIAGTLAQKKTECQESREKALKSNARIKAIIPVCDTNGDYAGLQCHEGSKFCSCWRKDGTPITQPSGKIKACECHRQKDESSKKGLIGAFIPQCAEDGKFHKKQCWGSTGHCWCADPETGKNTTQRVRGKLSC